MLDLPGSLALNVLMLPLQNWIRKKERFHLSIKLLEELKNKEAVSKFSSPLSGKNLPFSSLSDELEKKEKKE